MNVVDEEERGRRYCFLRFLSLRSFLFLLLRYAAEPARSRLHDTPDLPMAHPDYSPQHSPRRLMTLVSSAGVGVVRVMSSVAGGMVLVHLNSGSLDDLEWADLDIDMDLPCFDASVALALPRALATEEGMKHLERTERTERIRSGVG